MAFNKFIDVASYQPDTLQYFQQAKRMGVKAVIVKLTEGGTGTKYVNPKASRQISNAWKAGLLVHVYHFLKSSSPNDARGEARYFVQQAKARGIGKSSIMAIDVEDGGLSYNRGTLTAEINAFTDELHKQGYSRVAVYSNTSWFTTRINRFSLTAKSWWVAAYGVSQPGIDNAAAWQYSSTIKILGSNTDFSYDFTGFYTKDQTKSTSKPAPKPAKKPAPKPKPTNGWKDELGDTWTKQLGNVHLTSPVNLRYGAKINSKILATLPIGSVVKYDAYSYHNGYVWVRQPRGGGKYAYLATGTWANGRTTSNWVKWTK